MAAEKQLPVSQSEQTILGVVLRGDLKALSPQQKIEYYIQRCTAAGLDYRSQPFDYLELSGKETLYLNVRGVAQLNLNHKISHEITGSQEVLGGQAYCVTVKASTPVGVYQSASKFVPLVKKKIGSWDTAQSGKRFPVYAKDQTGNFIYEPMDLIEKLNALMKCETGAKIRATKMLTGEGAIDETEIEMIAGAVVVDGPMPTEEPESKKIDPVTAKSGSASNALVAAAKSPAPTVSPEPVTVVEPTSVPNGSDGAKPAGAAGMKKLRKFVDDNNVAMPAVSTYMKETFGVIKANFETEFTEDVLRKTIAHFSLGANGLTDEIFTDAETVPF
jgi:hypothetical protein